MTDPEEGRPSPLFVIPDTNVLGYLARKARYFEGYERLRRGRRLALPFQVEAEVRVAMGRITSPSRKAAVEALIQGSLRLPLSDSTILWYGHVATARRDARLLGAVEDGDCWVIAQALEYELDLMSHDRAMTELAKDLGVTVRTLLDEE